MKSVKVGRYFCTAKVIGCIIERNQQTSALKKSKVNINSFVVYYIHKNHNSKVFKFEF